MWVANDPHSERQPSEANTLKDGMDIRSGRPVLNGFKSLNDLLSMGFVKSPTVVTCQGSGRLV